jgi:hypothetical protein
MHHRKSNGPLPIAISFLSIAIAHPKVDMPGSSRRPSYRVWTTQFFCLTGLAAVQWQFGDKFSFNRSAEE